MDGTTLTLFALSLMAGLAMPLGAVLAWFEHINNQRLRATINHGVMAFGGGCLLAAVGLVLIPEARPHLSMAAMLLAFVFGALLFMAFDVWMAKKQSSGGQLAAMLADFIPESLALGTFMATGNEQVLLLAVLIAFQNVPEGFNAFREMKGHSRWSHRKLVFSFLMMALLGPVMAFTGYHFLADQHQALAWVMAMASGGVLYAVFQDIAPKVTTDNRQAPAMGAILGFSVGLFGLYWT